ncbi:MAG TPA: hypothetical protein VLC98_04480 [Phnomibacter sp.]|nr:hypothetical protein [Phnomibacter sp.]
MSLQKSDIVAPLLQQPDLPAAYPWYPTAYLAHAHKANHLQRLAAFVNHPLRVHLIVSEDTSPATTISPIEPVPTIAQIETVEEEIEVLPENAVESVEPAETEEKPLHIPGLAAAAAASESTDDDDSFLFQPYYTVDYFASQGIKTDLTTLSVTRFDQQLKSFSQWLKTMKRADYQTGQFTADPTVDAHAKASLEAKEVVTEAMAEVLAQQGRHSQAIAVYRKLTLLHPEKSTFFAAQIEKLKA